MTVFGGRKILVIEDDQKTTDVIVGRLEAAGYKTIIAKNGGEALKKAIKEMPDLILLDILISGMNGFAICTEIKSDPKTESIPIIMFTTKSEIEKHGGATGSMRNLFGVN